MAVIPENKVLLLQCIYVFKKHSYCSHEEEVQKTATAEKVIDLKKLSQAVK
jgi:hypothetical protein